MITNEQLTAVLKAEYPTLVPNVDYHVGRPVDPVTYKPIADATVVVWSAKGAQQPTDDQLKALIVKHVGAIAEANKPPVPEHCSPWQFIMQGVTAGMMTMAEGDALSKTGAIPSKFASRVSALPAIKQAELNILLSKAQTVKRNNEFITGIVMPAMEWTAAQCDQFFRDAAKRV